MTAEEQTQFEQDQTRVSEVIANQEAEKTNKDQSWWKDNMKTDLYLTAEQLKEFNVIDEII